jgi:hypothetical protein
MVFDIERMSRHNNERNILLAFNKISMGTVNSVLANADRSTTHCSQQYRDAIPTCLASVRPFPRLDALATSLNIFKP